MEPPDVPAHASRVPVTRFNLVLASPEKQQDPNNNFVFS